MAGKHGSFGNKAGLETKTGTYTLLCSGAGHIDCFTSNFAQNVKEKQADEIAVL